MATYANSITLTPGTITLAVDNDEPTIHALTPGAVEGLEGGEMDRRASRVELNKKGRMPRREPAA